MVTSSLLPDTPDEVAEAGIRAATRTAFVMSGSPIPNQNPGPWRCLACRDQGSTHLRRFGKYARRLKQPTSTTAVKHFINRADRMHDFAIPVYPRSIGAPAGDPVVPPSTKISTLVEQGILKTAPASDGSAYQKYVLRGFSDPGGAAAVERGIFPGRRLPHPSGRSQQGPAGSEARTACARRTVAGRWRYRGEGERCAETAQARFGLSDAPHQSVTTGSVCCGAGGVPPLPAASSQAGS